MMRVVISMMVAAMSAPGAQAASAPFDIAGPVVAVTVTRGDKILPISQVPNLMTGDRLWIKADLPANQSANYVLVLAFLRGATNPPPADWFFRSDTWKREARAKGMTVVVPPDAQQVVLFLAPQTSGDFKTLVGAVSGRPGAFVRASQDLNQAALDRSRLIRYQDGIAAINQGDPLTMNDTAPMLARSLAMKLDEKCLQQAPLQQAACLLQGQESLILSDGHSRSMVEALTNGPASDLAMEASFTPQLGFGYYSPYLASLLDIARIFDSFRTAQYQYIPGLAVARADRLNLSLNTPPSFHDPKSVLVFALPGIESAQRPPLRAVSSKDSFCATKPALVLPVEGAPLVFSTAFAHGLSLRVSAPDGRSVDLPARADAQRGGIVVDNRNFPEAVTGDALRGSIRGFWGFDEFEGPSFKLINSRADDWKIAAGEETALISGRSSILHLQAGDAACLERIALTDASGKERNTEWRATKPDEVELKLGLQDVQPGTLSLTIKSFGSASPAVIPVRAYTEAGVHEQFSMFAGDTQGILKGGRLDDVASLVLKGVKFNPGGASSSEHADEMTMVAESRDGPIAIKKSENSKARLTLKDGRSFDINASVSAPRPRILLLGKNLRLDPAGSASHIKLDAAGQLPQDAQLTFSVRAEAPTTFSRDVKIELEATDESFSTTLSRDDGTLVLEDRSILLATLNPLKAFGPSAFGALQFRVIIGNAASDWQPLATLVRLPTLTELKCPATSESTCKLSGANLFLIGSVANNAGFEGATPVPDGFPGDSLPVPLPTEGRLYVRLRDDPSTVNPVSLVPQPLTP